MAVISNASPLIALLKLTGLKSFISFIPVFLSHPRSPGRSRQQYRSCRAGFLVRPLAHPRQPHTISGSIGPGEHEVLNLGLELGAERLILDEQPARRLATSLGLRVIGTVGLLLAAKDRGILAKIKPGLDRLLASWPRRPIGRGRWRSTRGSRPARSCRRMSRTCWWRI